MVINKITVDEHTKTGACIKTRTPQKSKWRNQNKVCVVVSTPSGGKFSH